MREKIKEKAIFHSTLADILLSTISWIVSTSLTSERVAIIMPMIENAMQSAGLVDMNTEISLNPGMKNPIAITTEEITSAEIAIVIPCLNLLDSLILPLI